MIRRPLQITWKYGLHPDKRDCFEAYRMLADAQQLVAVEYRMKMAARGYRDPVESIATLNEADDWLSRTIAAVLNTEKSSPEHELPNAWLGDERLTHNGPHD